MWIWFLLLSDPVTSMSWDTWVLGLVRAAITSAKHQPVKHPMWLWCSHLVHSPSLSICPGDQAEHSLELCLTGTQCRLLVI